MSRLGQSVAGVGVVLASFHSPEIAHAATQPPTTQGEVPKDQQICDPNRGITAERSEEGTVVYKYADTGEPCPVAETQTTKANDEQKEEEEDADTPFTVVLVIAGVGFIAVTTAGLANVGPSRRRR